MKNSNILSAFFGQQSYTMPETGVLRDYIHFLLSTNGLVGKSKLTEALIYGLGSGRLINFRSYNQEIFHLSVINEILIKDALANLNIKAWYKTEPDSDHFIDYICRVLDKGQPVITYLEEKLNNCYLRKNPVAITAYLNNPAVFICYDYSLGKQIRITFAELKKKALFKDIGSIPVNFWFETALPEKLFPLERCIEWALNQNIQKFLYSSGDKQGISSIKSMLTFLQELSQSNRNELFYKAIISIQSVLKSNDKGAVANLDLFIDFLNIANKVLVDNKMETAILLFKRCVSDWNNFYLSLTELTDQKLANEKIKRSIRLGERIIETETVAWNDLQEVVFKKHRAVTLS